MTKNFEIIFEDDDLIVANKPAGLLTIPDRFDSTKPSLVGYLKSLQPPDAKVFIVHRLDRETSGILCFAKNEAAHKHLSKQFEEKTAAKFYLALVDGRLIPEFGKIDFSIAESATTPGKMVTAKRGKESLTFYKTLENFKQFTLVEAEIKTGRTHQIRVHFQSLGFPLAVDALYGRRDNLLLSEVKRKYKLSKLQGTDEERPIMNRTTLHAFRLELEHPTSGERVQFVCEPPKDFAALVSQLQKWGK